MRSRTLLSVFCSFALLSAGQHSFAAPAPGWSVTLASSGSFIQADGECKIRIMATVMQGSYVIYPLVPVTFTATPNTGVTFTPAPQWPGYETVTDYSGHCYAWVTGTHGGTFSITAKATYNGVQKTSPAITIRMSAGDFYGFSQVATWYHQGGEQGALGGNAYDPSDYLNSTEFTLSSSAYDFWGGPLNSDVQDANIGVGISATWTPYDESSASIPPGWLYRNTAYGKASAYVGTEGVLGTGWGNGSANVTGMTPSGGVLPLAHADEGHQWAQSPLDGSWTFFFGPWQTLSSNVSTFPNAAYIIQMHADTSAHANEGEDTVSSAYSFSSIGGPEFMHTHQVCDNWNIEP